MLKVNKGICPRFISELFIIIDTKRRETLLNKGFSFMLFLSILRKNDWRHDVIGGVKPCYINV